MATNHFKTNSIKKAPKLLFGAFCLMPERKPKEPVIPVFTHWFLVRKMPESPYLTHEIPVLRFASTGMTLLFVQVLISSRNSLNHFFISPALASF
jgi:hypothetical protein